MFKEIKNQQSSEAWRAFQKIITKQRLIGASQWISAQSNPNTRYSSSEEESRQSLACMPMRPSCNPKRLFEENNVSIPKSNEGILKPITQLWNLNGDCPTKKEDVLRASSIKGFGKKKHKTIPEPPRSAEPDLDKKVVVVNWYNH
ncbi:hypothetical protein HYC85_010630 [Camellia sinensis]|uniref:Uncharacterized protein n=1 Tax=Camellia sinensis TaxID=4442 RepID=A0A7J7HL67_CAMSI|nr:hypothetical protein HYC85_010630 [Camellia sinensis]